MNKKQVDKWIEKARDALIHCEIAKDGKIDKNFRSQISAFGAAVIMGSFKAAVAFYAKQGNADTERPALLEAIHYIITGEDKSADEIYTYICSSDNLSSLQADYINASIALKLAMNFFDMGLEDTPENVNS